MQGNEVPGPAGPDWPWAGELRLVVWKWGFPLHMHCDVAKITGLANGSSRVRSLVQRPPCRASGPWRFVCEYERVWGAKEEPMENAHNVDVLGIWTNVNRLQDT